MAFSKTISEKQLIIHCDSCFKNITTETFVRCAECVWDQCLICFQNAEDGKEHTPYHSFRLVYGLLSPLFEDDWRVIDELLLINGIITFGIGNFSDVSAMILNHNEESVKKHFYRLIGMEENTSGEVQIDGVPPKSDPNDKEVLSYMPLRKEFETEVFSEYEALIEDINFEEQQSGLEKAFRTYMLNAYKVVLKQRALWRNMLINRNLIAVQKIRQHEKTILGDIAAKWKWLLQFISKNDFNVFLDGLLRENFLREIIEKGEQRVDEKKLCHIALSKKEKELCKRLNMPEKLYIKLKRFAIECFVARKPLRKAMVRFFDEEFHDRVDVLYRWFARQNMVYRPSDGSSEK